MRSVFVALTTYQLMVADVYARYINEKYGEKPLVIIVGMSFDLCKTDAYDIFYVPDFNTGKIKRLWKRLLYGGNFFRFSSLYKAVKDIDNYWLFIFNDNEPITNKLIRYGKKHRNCKVVLIEEGIGTYATSVIRQLTFKEKIRLLCTSIIGSKMQYRAIGDNDLIDYAIVGNYELYRTLKKSEKQTVLPQSKSSICALTDKFLRDYFHVEPKLQKCDVVYLGQPFDEVKGMIKEEYDFLQEIVNICGVDRQILIKPHPRENADKYSDIVNGNQNVCVLDPQYSKIPMECLASFCNAKIIMAHSSSAAINLANMYTNIKSIFLFKLEISDKLNGYIFGTSSNYSDSIFRGINHNIYIPVSFDELTTLLRDDNQGENAFSGVGVGLSEIDSLYDNL